MVWFLIGFILTVVYIIKEHKWFNGVFDYIAMFLIGMFMTTVTWVIASCIVTCFVTENTVGWEVSTYGVEWITVSECELEPINDKEYIETVALDEEMYHRIIVERNGMTATELCDVENTIIQKGDEASVKKQTPIFKSDILSKIFVVTIDDRYVVTIPNE
jgi:hypothetical protein